MSASTRIDGVIMEPNKQIWVALQSIYGIGTPRARKICKDLNIAEMTKVKELDHEQVKSIQDYINQNFETETVLRRVIALALKHLRDVGCYRGTRHRRGLPVRGQRTKTNARTRKGPRGNRIAKKDSK